MISDVSLSSGTFSFKSDSGAAVYPPEYMTAYGSKQMKFIIMKEQCTKRLIGWFVIVFG